MKKLSTTMYVQMLTIVFFTTVFCVNPIDVNAQLGKKIKAKTKEKTETKTEDLVDRTIDKGFDKIDQGINRLFGGKNKKNQTSQSENEDAYEDAYYEESEHSNGGYYQEETSDYPTNNSGSSTSSTSTSLEKYKGFTFIPGQEIIAFDDFSNVRKGDIPPNWVSSGNAEVTNFSHVPGNWLWFNKTTGNFIPSYLTNFPDEFTLEFDLMYDFKFGTYSFKRNLMLVFSDITNHEEKLNWSGDIGYFYLQKLASNYTSINFSGIGSDGGPFVTMLKAVSDNKSLNFTSKYLAKDLINTNNINKPIHISISRNGRRLQVFADHIKILDITNAFESNVKLSSARFYVDNNTDNDHYYLSNIKYAVGVPNLATDFANNGSFVTSSITFLSGSADIRPESYTILKEIAATLKNQSNRSLLIIGHTDSDGSESANLSLSEMRAQSIKTALQQTFAVTNTINIQGKGESAPIADNNSPLGKSKNRRVEFILN